MRTHTFALLLQALLDHDRADHGEDGTIPPEMLLVPDAIPAHRRAVAP